MSVWIETIREVQSALERQREEEARNAARDCKLGSALERLKASLVFDGTRSKTKLSRCVRKIKIRSTGGGEMEIRTILYVRKNLQYV